MERNAEEAATKTRKLNEEVQALKRGLKEKEGQLAAAAKKADEVMRRWANSKASKCTFRFSDLANRCFMFR